MDEFQHIDFNLFELNCSDSDICDGLSIVENVDDILPEGNSPPSISSFTSPKEKHTSKCSSQLTATKSPTSVVPKKQKKKPKKPYYVKIYPVPRILKRDIRRDYARMFANVHNSTEINMIDSFFKFICKPDCQIKMRRKTSIPSSQFAYTNKQCTPRGTVDVLFDEETLLSFICHSFLLCSCFPDFVLKINNVSISQTVGAAGSKLLINAEFHGTKITSLPFTCPYCEQPELCRFSKGFDSTPVNILQIRANQIVFHLDEQHRAYKVECAPTPSK